MLHWPHNKVFTKNCLFLLLKVVDTCSTIAPFFSSKSRLPCCLIWAKYKDFLLSVKIVTSTESWLVTILKDDYTAWSGKKKKKFNVINIELQLHRPEWSFIVSTFLSSLGYERHNPCPEFWAKILPPRSSVEKSESGVARGCEPCQKGGEWLTWVERCRSTISEYGQQCKYSADNWPTQELKPETQGSFLILFPHLPHQPIS